MMIPRVESVRLVYWKGKLGDSGPDDRSRYRWKVERLKTVLPIEKRHRKVVYRPDGG